MGSGKSHTIRMAATFMKGGHVIFHPVPSMTANQITKFMDNCRFSFLSLSNNKIKEEIFQCRLQIDSNRKETSSQKATGGVQ